MNERIYHGFDWDSGSDVMVDQQSPADNDNSINYFDIGESKYHQVRVLDIRRDGKWLRLRVAANDGEERSLELIA